MIWTDALVGWAAHLRAGHKSEETIRLRLYHLSRCARELGRGPADVTAADLEVWLGRPGWKPTTTRSFRASLRLFYGWAVATGVVATSPAHLLPAVSVPRSMPRPTSDEAWLGALAAADDRERRALRLGADCGLRRGEIARAHTDDVVADLVGWCLRVVGKGGHVRLVPMPDDLALELRRLEPGWVFPSPRGGHLTPGRIGELVSALLPDGVSTHTLRHRAGTRAYGVTRDIRAVQEFLGHAKPETTAIYTEVGRSAIRAAMLGAVN